MMLQNHMQNLERKTNKQKIKHTKTPLEGMSKIISQQITIHTYTYIIYLIMKRLHLRLTLASSSFSMSSLDVENSLRVILGVLSPWPTEPIISCSFSWFTSAYMLIQGIFLVICKKKSLTSDPQNDVRKLVATTFSGKVSISIKVKANESFITLKEVSLRRQTLSPPTYNSPQRKLFCQFRFLVLWVCQLSKSL